MTDISHMIRQSEASTWDFCRRLWFLSYFMSLTPNYPEGRRMPSSKGKRDYGTVLHGGAEALHKGATMQEAELARAATLDELRNLVPVPDLPELSKAEDPAWWDIDRYTKSMLSSYNMWLESGVEAGNRTLAVEEAWTMPLPNIDATMYGKHDLVYYSYNENGVIVDDVKTVASFEPVHRANFQVRTYALAWWRLTGEMPVKGGNRQVKRVLSESADNCESVLIPITEPILLAHEVQLEARATEILTARTKTITDPTIYPRPNRDCSWRCPFGDVCVMIDDLDDFEFILEQNYFVREEGENE